MIVLGEGGLGLRTGAAVGASSSNHPLRKRGRPHMRPPASPLERRLASDTESVQVSGTPSRRRSSGSGVIGPRLIEPDPSRRTAAAGPRSHSGSSVRSRAGKITRDEALQPLFHQSPPQAPRRVSCPAGSSALPYRGQIRSWLSTREGVHTLDAPSRRRHSLGRSDGAVWVPKPISADLVAEPLAAELSDVVFAADRAHLGCPSIADMAVYAAQTTAFASGPRACRSCSSVSNNVAVAAGSSFRRRRNT